MPDVTAQITDDLYNPLQRLATKSGRTMAEELILAVQMYVFTELERHGRETIQDPKSPPSS